MSSNGMGKAKKATKRTHIQGTRSSVQTGPVYVRRTVKAYRDDNTVSDAARACGIARETDGYKGMSG